MYPKVLNNTKIGKKEVRLLFLFLVLFVTELLIFTWVRTQCLETGYKISELKREKKNITDTRDNLVVRRNQYKSPDRIGLIAEKYGGLSMPAQDQIILLE